MKNNIWIMIVASLFIVGLWIGLIAGLLIGKSDCNCDCGTLIMRQEFKEGHLDIPYDLNQFYTQISWNEHNVTEGT